MSEPNSNEDGVPTTKYQSSGAYRKFKDGKSKERKVLGDLEVFRDLIYKKANPGKSNDAAEKFIRTTEKLAEYVRGEYSSDMSYLIQFGTEPEFKMPEAPKAKKDQAVDEIAMVRYKTEYTFYLTQQETYKKHKAGVFGVILGQCHAEVKDALYRDPEYADIAVKNDVVKLLEKLRKLSHDCAETPCGLQCLCYDASAHANSSETQLCSTPSNSSHWQKLLRHSGDRSTPSSFQPPPGPTT